MKKLGIIYAPRDSASAAALAREVPLYRVGREGFKSTAGLRAFRRGADIINWGCASQTADIVTAQGDHGVTGHNGDVLNFTQCVARALSKLETLTTLKTFGIPALEATGEAITAQQWSAGGSIVLARRDGLSGGKGIRKVEPGGVVSAFHDTDFWVKYWKKTHEYRVHVFRGKVIDIQQKRRRTNWEGNYDPMIRNFDNGWVFCHDNIKGTEQELTAIGTTAQQAVACLGLDFGAVDVLARFHEDGTLRKHVVCEINTAPGLEGKTLERYVNAIREAL